MTEPTLVCLVPHTHWDREWYLPFQRFRMQLVDLVDSVLDLMDADARFAFTLDGQLSTVDDYLEIRPEAEERIRARIAEGRLAVGPWQILMDEFLVSGESIVRNLEVGWTRAEELGAVMPVAYLPDMFGHAAQMPQILHRAGIEHAAAWRGVPAAIDRNAFRWSAPDGSSVRAEYLVHGYGGAAHVLSIPERLADKIELLEEALRPFFGERAVLAMYGEDHSEPLPDLVDVVERVNAAQNRYRIEIDTLAGYFHRLDAHEERLPSWTGELRSAARANMLPGVTSARVDLKAACARAERLLERYAEPLQALHGDEWPEPFLRIAWDRVIANSAHDSICGCSVDAVNAQVLVRYAEAEQIASGLTDRAVARVAERVERGSVAVVNPSPHPRTGLVELDLPVPDGWEEVALELPDGSRLATQEVQRTRNILRSRHVRGDRIPELVSRSMHGRKAFHRFVNGFDVDRENGRRRLTFHVDTEPDRK
ncbi:MAG: alpha-mannosidase, partial [Actinobacteria bacterium]|nr:alpha-mannosidase [Actinomycetota bacterium]